MYVKPPEVAQPQATTEIPQNTTNSPLQVIEQTENKEDNALINPPSKIIQNPPEDKTVIIRKKREYKAFMKLIKQGKYTSAYMTSKILGVDKGTIQSWLHTPKVLECMDSEINNYISKISVSKDWKAQAYLLDKVTHEDSKEESTTSLQNLIQINVISK